MDDREFRLIFLGAGFSRPAGFPLGNELWPEVLSVVDAELGHDNAVRRDLTDFIAYKRATTGSEPRPDQVDFEEFIAFLDLEHYLGLRGSDTWSRDGNQAQLLLKWAIGRILYERLNSLSVLPDTYLRFAEQLKPGDVVVTFNYDTLLETALEYVGREYRLFPYRYTSIGVTANTVDSSKEEVVVLKLHGSIDWFDRSAFEERLKVASGTAATAGLSFEPRDPVFGQNRVVQPISLTDGPREPEDPLLRLFRVLDPGPLYVSGLRGATPFILSPSFNKLLYSSPLLDFWNSLGRAGGMQLGLAIVGFSLPAHDEYLRQVIYRVCRNYTESWWDESFAGRFKSPLRIVDYRPERADEDALRLRYSFLNWSRTETLLSGFDEKAVDFIFRRGVRAG